MANLAANLIKLEQRITEADKNSPQRSNSTQLIAVSKRHSADSVRKLFELGQQHFAENYLQEALAKQQQLNDLDICWHFIGHIQKNKTRRIAEHFSWVHSVDRLSVAQRLAAQRPPSLPALNICLQVNIDAEPSKSGVSTEELAEAVHELATLPGVRLRGLMAIPDPDSSPAQRLASMQAMAQAFDTLNSSGAQLDALSMGMSADLELAIQAGATMVRVGEALFGPRPSEPAG